MTPNEYQKEALRTASGMSQEYPRILNGLMGLNGEAGECIDILKKHLFQGHDLDREHMAKELGDVAWYLAVSADAIGYDLETIFQMNIDKLRARYPFRSSIRTLSEKTTTISSAAISRSTLIFGCIRGIPISPRLLSSAPLTCFPCAVRQFTAHPAFSDGY